MSHEDRSPWARGDDDGTYVVVPPPVPAARPSDPAAERSAPASAPAEGTSGAGRVGLITLARPAAPVRDEPVPEAPPDPPDDRRRLLWFGAGAGVLVIAGLVIVLILSLSGSLGSQQPGGSLFGSNKADKPPDLRPPLAKLCPPPSDFGEPYRGEAPPPPPGARTTDSKSGISYKKYDAPWGPWLNNWTAGELKVAYKTGQDIVTEVYRRGEYHASILSGSVPATVNDGVALDLKCTGRQVAGDVRASYYPQPNSQEMLRDEQVNVGGRQAWVTKFRLHFTETGLKATSELVLVALIDVGRPEAAVLYVSIPNTHTQLDWVVDDVLASVRPT